MTTSLGLSDAGPADLLLEARTEVDERTGSLRVTVGIPTAPGRDDFHPKLALSYAAGSGNSAYGLGWSLAGLAGITRDGEGAVPRYDGTDAYAYAGGRLVAERRPDNAGQYVPRTDTVGNYAVHYYRQRFRNGPPLRFERWIPLAGGADHWRIRDESNVLTVLGRAADGSSRITDPADDRRVFAWLPEASYDPLGNAIAYLYRSDDARLVGDFGERRRTGAETQRHLDRVRFGNVAPLSQDDPLPGAVGWHFETVVDYGNYAANPPRPAADTDWPMRPDPHSTCRPGFEVRTRRLARRFLNFSRFPELGAQPVLTGALELTHELDPAGSTLTSVGWTGYRPGNAPDSACSVPPLRFTYSLARIAASLEAVPASATENVPAGLSGGIGLVDLRGDGLPGILVETDDAWYYKVNAGGGRFEALALVGEKPSQRAGALGFGDYDRDGNVDLVRWQGRLSGAARFDRAAGTWSGYRPFDSAPRLDATGAEWLDLNGDGTPEMVQRGPFGLTSYPLDGANRPRGGDEGGAPDSRGFAPAQSTGSPAPTADRPPLIEDPEQSLFLLDLDGDGLLDQVLLGNGRVEYWPGLGNGSFGQRVVMTDPPRFAPDGAFDAGRLRFLDLDGTGTTDVLYLGPDDVRWWFNHAGNGFVEGGRVAGMPTFDTSSPAQVLDLLGDGTPCLVVSSPVPGRGEPLQYLRLTDGIRPRLLVGLDNSTGATTRIRYSTSAAHYLRAGASEALGGTGAWNTRLPSHVQVVDSVELADAFAGTTSTSRYVYADGYFDGGTGSFAGFARVDRYDSQQRDDEDDSFTAASCSRTWFHTGDPEWHRALAPAYLEADLAWPLPPLTVENPGTLTPAEHADALRAVAGQEVREEIYAVGPGDELGAHPLSVTTTRHGVRRLQPATVAEPASLLSFVAERSTLQYEQAPDDPRINSTLALSVDDTGTVLLDCSIAYPRRAPHPLGTPAQGMPVVTATRTRGTSIDTVQRHEIGIPVEHETFDVRGLAVSGDALVGWDTARTAVQAALATIVGPASPAPAPPFVRRTGWERSVYWNAAQSAAEALGTVGPVILLHSEASAVFDDALLSAAYDPAFGPGVDAVLLQSLGYVADAGYWWQPDPVQEHAAAADFYRLLSTRRWDGAVSQFGWDQHRLVQTSVTDAAGNTTVAAIDYVTLKPQRTTDPNGMVRECRYDALGVPVLTTEYGTVNGAAYGQLPLASYVAMPDTSVDTMIADPARYLQGAAQLTEYDLDAPVTADSPRRQVTLTRENLVRDGTGGPSALPGRIAVVVAYLDGSGRVCQLKTRVEAGPAITRNGDGAVRVDNGGTAILAPAAQRWQTSGWVSYDARQQPVEESEPYFSPTPAFEDDAELRALGSSRRLSYDGAGRLVREDEPDGSYSRVEYGAWEVRSFDRNDTVADSRYRLEREALPADDPQRRALAGAMAHAGTPSTTYLDPLGQDAAQRDPTGNGDRVITTTYDANGEPVRTVDGRGLTTLRLIRDLSGRTLAVHSADAGPTWLVPDAANREALAWNGRRVLVRQSYDGLDRHRSTGLRMPLADGSPGPELLVEEVQYGEDPGVATPNARNARTRPVRHREQAGVVEIERYDPFGRVLRSSRRFRTAITGEPDWSTPAAVGLGADTYSSTGSYDALGRLIRAEGPDGSVRRFEYLAGGGASRVTWGLADGSMPEVVALREPAYDARGRRTGYSLGNGVRIEREFGEDPDRITSLRAIRPAAGANQERVFSALQYTYDPVGNVTRYADSAQEPAAATPLLTGATVSAIRDYTYDAVYQLKTATGRIHQALLEHDYRAAAPGTLKGTRHLSLNNGAALERYTEQYDYDLAGNLVKLRHVGATNSWTTDKWVSAASNRALPARDPSGAAVTDPESRFDAAGNTVALPHLRSMSWSYRNTLARAVVVDRPGNQPDDAESYVYDAVGRRVRKVTTRLVDGEVETTDRLYLDGCEVKRIIRGGQMLLERRTSDVLDGDLVVARVHRWTADVEGRETSSVPARKFVYPLRDALGSSVLELDGAAGVVGYEELLPYGGSAFLAGQNARDVAARDYRYLGKERDDATGLFYFGYRYYAPWIGNWVSPDPSGPQDSFNLYQFALSNPVTFADQDGLQTTTAKQPGKLSVVLVTDLPALFQRTYGTLTESQKVAFANQQLYLYYDPATKTVLTLSPTQFFAHAQEQTAAGKNVALFDQAAAPTASDGAGGTVTSPAAQPEVLEFEDDEIVVPAPKKPDSRPVGDGQASTAGSGAGGGGEGKKSKGSGAGKGAGTATGKGAGTATGNEISDPNAAVTPGGGTGSGGADLAVGGDRADSDVAGGDGAAETKIPAGGGTGSTGSGPGSRKTGTGTGGGGSATQDTGQGGAGGGTGAGSEAGTGLGEGTGTGSGPEGTGEGSEARADGATGKGAGGVEGGIEAGQIGGVLTGTDTGSPEGRTTVGPGSNGFDPNGTLDGYRFSTRSGTGSGSTPGPGLGTANVRGGRKGGKGPGGENPNPPKATTLDRWSRYAGYANLEGGGGKDGVSGGVPGGTGRFNLGAGGQLAYIGITIASFLVGAGEMKLILKGGWKLGLKGVLSKVVTKVRGLIPAAKAAVNWAAGQLKRGAASVSSSGLGTGMLEVTMDQVITELRKVGTKEAYATVALIKRGYVDVLLAKNKPATEMGGLVEYGSKRAIVWLTHNHTLRDVAATVAHETKHVLQKLTKRTYHRGHEFEAYTWTGRVSRNRFIDVDEIWDYIRSSPLYKNVPEPPPGWKPNL